MNFRRYRSSIHLLAVLVAHILHTQQATAEMSAETSSPPECVFDKTWLGSEPNQLPVDQEEKGVQEILDGLPDEALSTITVTDLTIPIRYFRAEKGNVKKAIGKIQATLKWRKDFEVDIIRDCFSVKGTPQDTDRHKEMREILEKESETGKMYVRGYDKEGRSLQYMCQMRENTWNETSELCPREVSQFPDISHCPLMYGRQHEVPRLYNGKINRMYKGQVG